MRTACRMSPLLLATIVAVSGCAHPWIESQPIALSLSVGDNLEESEAGTTAEESQHESAPAAPASDATEPAETFATDDPVADQIRRQTEALRAFQRKRSESAADAEAATDVIPPPDVSPTPPEVTDERPVQSDGESPAVSPTGTEPGNPLRQAGATETLRPKTQRSRASSPPSRWPTILPEADPAPSADLQGAASTQATATEPDPPAEPVQRLGTIEQQYRLAQRLGTVEAYRAVLDNFPNAPRDWRTDVFRDVARQKIAQAEQVAPSDDDDAEPPAETGLWRGHVSKAIDQIQRELAHGKLSDETAIRHETLLRLLCLIDQRHAEAAEPIELLDGPEQAFWRHQLYGLAIHLDERDATTSENRQVLALRELRSAVSELAAATPKLDVQNVVFCSEVQSFGNFEQFDKAEFVPDQEVILYCEIENFTVESTADGEFTTSLQGSYQVYDHAGRRVAERTFPMQRETCRNCRRDFFIPYRMWIPKSNVAPGDYTLQLTIEDTLGEKFGQASVPFRIRAPR